MTHYNLDRMQFTPGPPATFLPEETPQGAEWWAENRDTEAGRAIIDLLVECHAQLAELHRQHMKAAA